MGEARSSGFKVVLTADRTLLSEYHGGIFLGFSACVPRGMISDWLYFSLFCPSVEVNEDGSVDYAPCGLRKIEATLLDYGFKEKDVIVAHPEHLDRVIGPETRVLGITENDPLGIGPATTTFTQLLGGEAYMKVKFRELLSHPTVRRYRPRIIVGGPGAWQLEDEVVQNTIGIDCVVIGEGEKVAGPLFERAVKGYPLPRVVYGKPVPEDEIPVIRKATIDGIVEIARGCGRGCVFCIPTLQRYRCLSLEHILKEVEVNLRAGRQPLLHAEDVLRYKAKGLNVNEDAVIELFKRIMEYPGVSSIGISHFALSSVASAPSLVEEISNIVGVSKEQWFSGQTGIETGSPRLIERYMRGKCKPFKPGEWPQVVINAFEVLAENNWVPCSTLIIGLPGETEKDVELTLDLVQELRPFKSLIVPLFFVSIGRIKDQSESFTLENMTPKQAELLLKCWEHNLQWGPVLLREYFLTKKGITRYSLKSIFSYAISQGRRLIKRCRDQYNYDIITMIRDARNRRLDMRPLPINFAWKLIKTIARA